MSDFVYREDQLAHVIKEYVDAAIEHAIADLDVGADGYTSSHPHERAAKDAAFSELRDILRDSYTRREVGDV